MRTVGVVTDACRIWSKASLTSRSTRTAGIHTRSSPAESYQLPLERRLLGEREKCVAEPVHALLRQRAVATDGDVAIDRRFEPARLGRGHHRREPLASQDELAGAKPKHHERARWRTR